ncbi:hypothetical protein [Domibacillus indicus]|uniref:hypothetical protein n=1 Tax=Domibacillus indicus TaxID=1437523 RepID=UPI00061807CD|nr:hypothetical protein [Domibacillus indicus]
MVTSSQAGGKVSRKLKQQEERIKQSPYSLNNHLRAPTDWINDPYVFAQYKGKHYLIDHYCLGSSKRTPYSILEMY